MSCAGAAKHRAQSPCHHKQRPSRYWSPVSNTSTALTLTGRAIALESFAPRRDASNEAFVRQRFQCFEVSREYGLMASGLDCGHFPSDPFGLLPRAGRPGRLPTHGLPLAVALEKGSGVQVIRDHALPVLHGRPDQAEGDDRGIAVLLNANVFGAVSSRWASGLSGWGRAHVAHDVRLADPTALGAGVNQGLGPK